MQHYRIITSDELFLRAAGRVDVQALSGGPFMHAIATGAALRIWQVDFEPFLRADLCAVNMLCRSDPCIVLAKYCTC